MRTILIILVAFLTAQGQLSLMVDSIEISEAECAEGNCYTVSIKWKMCNNDSLPVNNLNRLWYVYATDVKTDSTYLGRSKKKVKMFGVGNTIVKLVTCKDTILSQTRGFIEVPDVDNSRFTLNAGECKSGHIGAFFDNLKDSTDYSLVVEYNTKFQRSGEVPLWRGELHSPIIQIDIQ